MNTLSNRTMPIAAIVAFSLSLLTAPDVTEAAYLFCGQPITSNTELDADLDCESLGTHGLIIAANNVTIDLNSFTITGGVNFFGVQSVGFDNVKIENGTIKGFLFGVFVDMAENVKLENLVIRDTLRHGIRVANSSSVTIENLSLFGPPRDMTMGRAILLQAVDRFKVDNVDVHGYNDGVLIICFFLPDCVANTDGAVTNSTFSDTTGVVLVDAMNVEISGNHISNCTIPQNTFCNGIVVSRSSEIEVKNNYVHDNLSGIVLVIDVTDSQISANHVFDNTGVGINLVATIPGSTDNEIKSNITFGNTIDLAHGVPSSPNEWKNNSCVTKEGGDIPEC